MAGIKTGSIVSDIRGSVGNQTYSRNQGGLYVSARAGPAGEPTQNQIDITDAMRDLAQAWSAELSQAERDSWQQYAAQHPRPNRWGDRLLNNGYTRFIGVNFPEYVRTSAIFRMIAPVAPPLGPPAFSFELMEFVKQIDIDLPLTIPLPDDSTLRAYLYLSPYVSQGVSYYSAPFAYIATNLKTDGNWSSDPWRVNVTVEFGEDVQFFARLRVQDTITGAISTVAQASAKGKVMWPP